MRTAPTGRTHGCTDQVCDVKKILANPEPSTHMARTRSANVLNQCRVIEVKRTAMLRRGNACHCRVGPGNFTLSLSQNRT
jgi:hypothetical protein